jgi:hypothetical protein
MFLSYQTGLSVHWLRGHRSDSWTCEVVRCWDFKRWTGHASLVCFRLSESGRAVRCCSHLARPCKVFHKWVRKTCGTIYDQSHDVWPESHLLTRVRHTTRVASSDQSQEYDWSHVFRLESRLLTGVGHTTGVVHTTGVTSSDRSWAYDQSRIIQPESGIQPESHMWPESCLSTGVGHTMRVVRYLHYKHV